MQKALLYLPLHQGAALLSSRSFMKQGQFQHTLYSRADTRAGTKHPIPSRTASPLFNAPFPGLTGPAPWKQGTSRSTGRAPRAQEAATPPVPAPCGGSVMGGRNMALSLPDMLAISGSCDS